VYGVSSSMVQGKDLDFRDEVMAQIFDKGDPLTFTVDLTDDGETTGPATR
jgi:hypothetical protein